MTKAQICIMISIVVYLFAMVMIGVVYSKKTKNVGDFYLGGRKLGPLVTEHTICFIRGIITS